MSKYGAKKVIVDDIKFDSKMESEFYLFLKDLKKSYIIKDFELQPKFELQEKFTKNNKKFRSIEYKADFLIYYSDGRKRVVDVKGFETPVFKLKQKLFEKKFSDISLELVTKSPKKFGGGWILVSELKELRKQSKKKEKLQ